MIGANLTGRQLNDNTTEKIFAYVVTGSGVQARRLAGAIVTRRRRPPEAQPFG